MRCCSAACVVFMGMQPFAAGIDAWGVEVTTVDCMVLSPIVVLACSCGVAVLAARAAAGAAIAVSQATSLTGWYGTLLRSLRLACWVVDLAA